MKTRVLSIRLTKAQIAAIEEHGEKEGLAGGTAAIARQVIVDLLPLAAHIRTLANASDNASLLEGLFVENATLRREKSEHVKHTAGLLQAAEERVERTQAELREYAAGLTLLTLWATRYRDNHYDNLDAAGQSAALRRTIEDLISGLRDNAPTPGFIGRLAEWITTRQRAKSSTGEAANVH